MLSLGPIRTHHNLTTQTITFRSDAQTARVVTYFQGVHVSEAPTLKSRNQLAAFLRATETLHVAKLGKPAEPIREAPAQ